MLRNTTLRSTITLAAMAFLTLVLALPAGAEVVLHQSIEQGTALLVPCANGGLGEVVSGTIRTHVLITSVVDGAGNEHLNGHIDDHSIELTGLSTGDSYHSSGFSNATLNRRDESGETYLVHLTTKVVGPGPDNDFFFRSAFRLIVDANGEVRVEEIEQSAICM